MPKGIKRTKPKPKAIKCKKLDMPKEIFENTIKMLNSSHKHFDHTPAGRLGRANLVSYCNSTQEQTATDQSKSSIENKFTFKEQEIQRRCRKRIQIAEGTCEHHSCLDKFEPGTLYDIFGELKKCQEQQNWRQFSELILFSIDKISYFSELDFLVDYMLSAVLYDPKCGASGRCESIIQGIIGSASSNKNSEIFLKNLCYKANMRLTDVTIPKKSFKDNNFSDTDEEINLENLNKKNDTIKKSTKKTPGLHKRCARNRSMSRHSKRIKHDREADDPNQQNNKPKKIDTTSKE